jgi:hypothetical protein
MRREKVAEIAGPRPPFPSDKSGGNLDEKSIFYNIQ